VRVVIFFRRFRDLDFRREQERVFDAGLLLFHFDLGGSANLDHGNTAGELGNTLLELFL